MSPSKPLSERSPNHQPTSVSSTGGGEGLDKPTKPNNSGDDNNNNNQQKKAMPRLELNATTTLNHSHQQQQQQQQQGLTYVSPSDAIRSPTTKKLSEIKGKRFQNAKPQTLFAKTLALQGLKAQEKLDRQ